MLKLADVFCNHMILQRDKEIFVWGEADEGKTVEVCLSGRIYSTKCIQGKWKTTIGPIDAGGPYIMDVVCGEEKITVNDILAGEVWLAGGQSNMEMPLSESENGKQEMASAKYKNIRFYNVPKIAYEGENVEKSTWENAFEEKAGKMSAVAYYFAKELYHCLKVPIGIIDCYWGGTSALCWISEEIAERDEIIKRDFESINEIIKNKSDWQYEQEMKEYNRQWNLWNNDVEALKKEIPDIKVEEINKRAGECPWPQPIGRKSPFRPFGLHKTMIQKIAPYGIRGMIYYQGEEDWSRAEIYDKLNSMVVEQWRKDFEDENLDFYITQLPMYIARGVEDDKQWCVLREKQEKVMRENRNVGLAVLIDCGEFDNVHPVDKATPGHRLALQSLGRTYRKLEKFDNMYFKKAVFREGKAYLEFENTYGDINTDGYPRMLGFEISADGKCYYQAEGKIQGDTISIWNPLVRKPQYVRYGWTNYGTVNIYNGCDLPLAPFNTQRQEKKQ